MHSELEKFALNLVRGAFMELYLTPKPGLVDQYDSGSHPDLSLSRMEASLKIVSCYLLDLSRAVRGGEDLAEQVRIGSAAERAMLKTVGTNCHKGYIFLSGLLLSASSQAPRRDESALRRAVAGLATQFFAAEQSGASNGSLARSRFQTGGVRAEALGGLPSLFDEALPAFRREIASGGNRGSAVYAMLGRLMATVDDTTALHRCGRDGLLTLQEDGRILERLVADREDFIGFLSERNDHYVSRNLTMGGVADLLALAFAWLSHTGELEAGA
ncbi:MAG: 2-(5'-triphosphoribosyl)-3'-dephospho CoA synthase [Geobacteraceae bacterium GWC2_58_44]|nr:MAG: 2-(5'-triphosphoribosyl)-3'-dephospho CoA synthase [Geobacteraceae bacterium GWC2_58_44]